MNEVSNPSPETSSQNWQGLRQFVLANSSAMEKDEIKEILARRAAELARMTIEEKIGEQVDLLLVRLGRELYGLDTRYVDRVEPVKRITRVPRVPDWVVGVVNLRGRILSVVDLVRFFDLPFTKEDRMRDRGNGHGRPTQEAKASDLVFVDASDIELALLVDEALTVESIPVSRMQEAVGALRGLRPEYVRGIIEWGKDGTSTSGDGDSSMVVILDLPTLLADERLVVQEKIV
jgi:purine-binding chemotaxis protein CheW